MVGLRNKSFCILLDLCEARLPRGEEELQCIIIHESILAEVEVPLPSTSVHTSETI